MKNKFTITIYRSKKSEEKKLANYLSKNGFGYWKYFNEMWIIVAPNHKQFSANKIRNEIKDIFPNKRLLVLDLGRGELDWSAFGNPKDFEWFRKSENL